MLPVQGSFDVTEKGLRIKGTYTKQHDIKQYTDRLRRSRMWKKNNRLIRNSLVPQLLVKLPQVAQRTFLLVFTSQSRGEDFYAFATSRRTHPGQLIQTVYVPGGQDVQDELR